MNPWEQNARNNKAINLALFLAKHDINSTLAEMLGQKDWELVASTAGFHTPSLITQAMTLDWLREMEKADAYRNEI